MSEGGINQIVAALRRHEDAFTVIDYGCFALCNIGDECALQLPLLWVFTIQVLVDYKVDIIDSGGARYAIDMLKKGRDNNQQLTPPLDLLTVLSQGWLHLRYMVELTWVEPQCKDEYGEEILDTVHALLQVHDNESVVSHALGLIVMLCEDAGMP